MALQMEDTIFIATNDPKDLASMMPSATERPKVEKKILYFQRDSPCTFFSDKIITRYDHFFANRDFILFF